MVDLVYLLVCVFGFKFVVDLLWFCFCGWSFGLLGGGFVVVGLCGV